MRWKLWAGAALLLVVGFLLGWSVHPAPTNVPSVSGLKADVSTAPREKARAANLMIDFGDGDVRTWSDVAFDDGASLLDLTRSLSRTGKGFVLEEKPPGDYGIMVDRIGEMRNGTDGKYWLFYVNGKMAEQSADRTALSPGDVVEWKFVNLKMDAAE